MKDTMHTAALVNLVQSEPRFLRAFELQVATQREFYERAAAVVGDACPMGQVQADLRSIDRNFFSTFFLVATELLVGRSEHLPLYAMVNQGMRAWVTACDNLLDDEYKEIFPFDLPNCGERTRSVLTLLIADRIVTEFAMECCGDVEVVEKVGRISLRALLPSALQEGEEEHRPVAVLPPEEILRDVHQLKTGDLFTAPLALPRCLEEPAPARVKACLAAVESFGLGCQVLDDVKDLPDDVRSGRHNLLVSLITRDHEETNWLDRLRAEPDADWAAWERFPDVAAEAGRLAVERFRASFQALAELGLELPGVEQGALVGCMCELLRVPSGLVADVEGVN